jgi:hypothetical protein
MVIVLEKYNLADFLVSGAISFVLGFFAHTYYKETQNLFKSVLRLALVFVEFILFALMWGIGLLRDSMGWGLKCSLIIIEFSKFSLSHANDSLGELQYQKDQISAEICRKYSNTNRRLNPEGGYAQENGVNHQASLKLKFILAFF